MVRNVRQVSGLPPRKGVRVDVVCAKPASREGLQRVRAALIRYAVIDDLTIVDRAGYVAPKLAGAHATGDVEVVVHLEGLIDPAKERERLSREIAKAEKDLAGLRKRRESPDYAARAPAEVVEQGKKDMAALEEKLLRLGDAIMRLG
jgi:valyl-tRNA synthetase